MHSDVCATTVSSFFAGAGAGLRYIVFFFGSVIVTNVETDELETELFLSIGDIDLMYLCGL